MRTHRVPATLLFLSLATAAPLSATTVAIQPGTYTVNFDSMAAFGSTEPAAGWGLRTRATATAMGTVGSTANAPFWSDSGGGFRNVSSSNIPSGSDTAAQVANSNRALGFRQTTLSSFNAGLAVCFNFSTANVQIDGFSMDLLCLEDAAARTTTYTIQYGLGATPGSWTTLDTWTSDGTFGATPVSFDRSDFGSDLDQGSQVWLRIVTLSAGAGSGSVYDLLAVDNFSMTASAVPEPSALLLGGLGVLGLFRRRRQPQCRC